MAQPAEKKWKYAIQIEAKILALFNEAGKPTFLEIDQEFHEFRLTCQDVIFLDFDYAARVGVGKHLWDAHTLINNRYRKLLIPYQRGELKDHVVERRKLEKRYVDFLKTSQFFYKCYIQRLASHFGGMPKLVRVAGCMELDLASVEEPVMVSEETARLLESSCHAVLLRLGDLSRYRNMIRTKNSSWKPALGHYALANDLKPEDGTAHNQMAVVALADQNHLAAVYHLYRAATAIEPHILARGNLELEFKKIIGVHEKQRAKANMDSLETLEWWFVLLQSKFYDGAIFSLHHELENEVVSRLAKLLQKHSFGETLEKIVLISIAAQFTAITRINEEKDNVRQTTLQSFYFCLGFNVRVMNVLLQVLLPEITDSASGEDLTTATGTEKISATARRVLPALRQYAIWLAGCYQLILNIPDTEEVLRGDIKNMWKLFAAVLTRMANFFPIFDFSLVEYLLEEDASTEGFEPFRNPDIIGACNFYCDEANCLKPRITDLKIQRHHPDLEMQSRILNIVVAALSLVNEQKIPLQLGDQGSDFSYIEEVLRLEAPHNFAPNISTPVDQAYPDINLVQHLSSSREVDCPTPPGYGNNRPLASYTVAPAQSTSASDCNQSMDTDMHRMVDDLLESRSTPMEETSYGMRSGTANEIFAGLGSNGYHHCSPVMLPSLPGLYTSAFTPQADELQPTSPHRPTTARELSPLSLSTKEKRSSAADALDQMTGFSNGSSGSWGRRSSGRLSNHVSQSVNQSLQESLAQRYMSSAAFTDSSSLYADATQQRFNAFGSTRTAAFGTFNAHNSTVYPGASDFEKAAMLQSSLWNGSQPTSWGGNVQTPPGGQGG